MTGDFASRVIRHFHWKIEYASKHGMLSQKLVAADLRHLSHVVCNLEAIQEDYENVTIYEVIAYLHKCIFPLLIEETNAKDNNTVFRNLFMREIPSLLAVVADKCKYKQTTNTVTNRRE